MTLSKCFPHRYAAITARLAELETQFMQNVMADEGEWAMEVSLAAGDLDGCSAGLIAAARAAAEERASSNGRERPDPDQHAISLNRSLVEPFLTFAENRELRERAWSAWTKRGDEKNMHVGCIRRACMIGHC